MYIFSDGGRPNRPPRSSYTFLRNLASAPLSEPEHSIAALSHPKELAVAVSQALGRSIHDCLSCPLAFLSSSSPRLSSTFLAFSPLISYNRMPKEEPKLIVFDYFRSVFNYFRSAFIYSSTRRAILVRYLINAVPFIF